MEYVPDRYYGNISDYDYQDKFYGSNRERTELDAEKAEAKRERLKDEKAEKAFNKKRGKNNE